MAKSPTAEEQQVKKPLKLNLTALQRWQLCNVLDQQTGDTPGLAIFDDIQQKVGLGPELTKRLVITIGEQARFNEADAQNVFPMDYEFAPAEERALRAVFKSWPGFRQFDRRTWAKTIIEALAIE